MCNLVGDLFVCTYDKHSSFLRANLSNVKMMGKVLKLAQDRNQPSNYPFPARNKHLHKSTQYSYGIVIFL